MKTGPSLLCILVSLPALAQAQSQVDATFSLQYADQPDNIDYQNTELSGSVSYGFGNNIGIQVDSFFLRYANYPDDDISGTTLHLTYDVTPTASIGGFYTWLNWEGDDWADYGLEATITSGRFQWDAVAAIDYDIDDDEGTAYGALYLTYDLADGYTVGASLAHYDGYHLMRGLSVGKQFANNVNLRLAALDTRDEGMVFRMAIGFDIGNGAKFRRPDYAGVFNVW